MADEQVMMTLPLRKITLAARKYDSEQARGENTRNGVTSSLPAERRKSVEDTPAERHWTTNS